MMTHTTVMMTHKTVMMTHKTVMMTHKTVMITHKTVTMMHEAESKLLEAKTLEEKVPSLLPPYSTARWSTALSSKVNLPHAVNFKALCGANLVT